MARQPDAAFDDFGDLVQHDAEEARDARNESYDADDHGYSVGGGHWVSSDDAPNARERDE